MLLSAGNLDLTVFVVIGFVIVGLVLLLRYFKQPSVIAYIIAGVLLGRHGFEIIVDEEIIHNLGELGLILLLFFIGMEINLPDFMKTWKIASYKTLLQILGSILTIGVIGFSLDWPINRIIIIGFVISLSSSAVIIKLLQDSKESKTKIGQNVISILLIQDILIVPMVIATKYLGGTTPSTSDIALQILGGILLVAGMIWVLKRKNIDLPFKKAIMKDSELQVFLALVTCFGCAIVTAFFGLSASLGAFVGGMIVHATNSSRLFHESLHSLRVIFVALFFISIGMLIDLNFLVQHWKTIITIIFVAYFFNHLINALVLQLFDKDWKSSIYGGALLAQIGELGFILVSSAYAAEIVSNYGYQLSIIVISLTLLISPFWISITKKALDLWYKER